MRDVRDQSTYREIPHSLPLFRRSGHDARHRPRLKRDRPQSISVVAPKTNCANASGVSRLLSNPMRARAAQTWQGPVYTSGPDMQQEQSRRDWLRLHDRTCLVPSSRAPAHQLQFRVVCHQALHLFIDPDGYIESSKCASTLHGHSIGGFLLQEDARLG